MTESPAVPPIEPRFPGGFSTAPEVTGDGCANPPCSCAVEPDRAYCCRACARAEAEADACACGHPGCAAWPG